MSGPANDAALAPARRGRGQPAPQKSAGPVTSDYDDAEVARGQAAAVLGALARMQLRLDVVAREQSDMFAKVMSLLEEINDKLTYGEEEVEEGADSPLAE